MNIRKDDMVKVITGVDKGKVAKVLRVLNDKNKIVVEGIAQVYRHTKPSRQNQQGGRISKEMPIAASNVMIFCNACRDGVRQGRRFSNKGQKERYCKKCGGSLGTLGRAKAVHAAK
jgi:large subunit ribosomal protein L24